MPAAGLGDMARLVAYFGGLSRARLVLWGYLAWYLAIVTRHAREITPSLGLTSLGMSAIIGCALVLSTREGGQNPRGWSLARLFIMPFCVSSYAALIKGQGYYLIFPPTPRDNLIGLGGCATVLALHLGCRAFSKRSA
jgi:hypothetical protein